MKRFAVFLFALILSIGPLHTAQAASQEQEFVQTVVDEAIVLLKSKESLEERLNGLREMFVKYMDFPFIGRFVLGRHWNQLDEKTQARYRDAFQDYVVNIYAKRLNEYSGETIQVAGSRAVNAMDTVVSSEIRRRSGPPVALDWRVREINGKDQIIDVAVEGVSMAQSQREEFATFLQRSSIDDLIARMKAESGA